MTDREAMQMALGALESSRVFVTSREKIKHSEGTKWYDERIEALRTALAQPEKEWVGLTDEERKAIYEQADTENWHDQPLLEAVEAKLKEKNNG